MSDKWFVVSCRDDADPEDQVFTISTNPKFTGWRTDSGYKGYGLPKEIAVQIVEILNREKIEPKWVTIFDEYWKKK